MKMCLLLLVLLLSGCGFEEDEAVRYLPINPKELVYHKGDVLAFDVDNGSRMRGAAIVTGFSKEADDSTHIWYELICTDYSAAAIPTLEQVKHCRLFGRKIESSVDPAGYITGLDVESVRNNCLVDNASKFHLIGRLPLDTTSVKMGAQGATSSYREFVNAFLDGKQRRQLPPDHYTKYFDDTFRPDEYFPIGQYLLKPS